VEGVLQGEFVLFEVAVSFVSILVFVSFFVRIGWMEWPVLTLRELQTQKKDLLIRVPMALWVLRDLDTLSGLVDMSSMAEQYF
jgi:hypothetical protein